MLASLLQFALSQRLLVVLLAVLVLGLGSRAVLELPIDAFPDISPTQAKVIIKAPGMTPEEVEQLITNPIEVELLGIPRQTILRSISKYALTSITLDFEEGTDIYWARQQVSERLGAVWENLPPGIEGGLAPISTPLGEMFMFTIDNDALSLAERRFLLDWTLRPALRAVPGVADVNALGGRVRTYQVTPRPEAMSRLGVSLDALESALQNNNRNDGAGRLEQGEEALLVRVQAAIEGLQDIRDIMVSNNQGEALRLAEIAEVEMGSLERYGVVTSDGEGEVVQGLVIGLRGANAGDVVTAVRAKLEELTPTLPPGTRINIFYDRLDLINAAVGTVSMALVQAVLLVILLLALFLGNLRAAISVAVVLPMATLVAFLMMRWADMSANLMSLGGLAIAIGMLVDSAIVIVENIQTTLNREGSQGSGRLPRLHLVYRAVREVALPVTAGVAIIVIVFLPLLSLEGLEGRLFAPVTLSIIFALVGALLLSFTLIPVLASLLVRPGDGGEPWLPRMLEAAYRPLLQASLRQPLWLLGLAVGLLLLTALVFPRVGRTFMPTMDEGDILVQLESLPSINLEASTHAVLQVERALRERVPEILRIVSRTGSDELGLDPMGLNETDIFMQLAPRESWRDGGKAALEERIREVMEGVPGISHGFTQPIDMRVSEMLTGSRGDVAIKLFGPELDVLNEYSQRIARLVEQVPGSVDTLATLNEGAQYLRVSPNRMLAGQLGLDAQALQARLRTGIEGRQLGVVLEQAARVPLVLRYDKPGGDGAHGLASMLIELANGEVVPLASLARIERVEGPVLISREAGQRFSVVRTNVEGRDLVGFVDEIRARIGQQIDLPQGYSLEWGGEFENQARASARLVLVLPLALGLIALLLFITFRSMWQTLIVLSNIPFALTGGILALWVSGEFLSVPASVGFIALLGIAVLNGVVMVDHFNYLRAKGMAIETVVIEGALRRLRPVMMTASTCAFGLLPLLLASGPGSEIQRPLAIVVIGGLLTSTLLTLFLLPLVYGYFHRQQADRNLIMAANGERP